MSRSVMPLLIHGRRRIKDSMLAEFQESYAAYSEVMFATPGIKAVFAFADAEDLLTFWHTIWSKDVGTFDAALARSMQAHDRVRSSYESSPEDPDAMDVYGGWNEAFRGGMQCADRSVIYNFHASMAGYMKPDGAGEQGPPMIGFTKRHVKSGHMNALTSSFQTVCDLWYEKVPGILAATVCQDLRKPNMVHDVRVFANHAAFQMHVDKSDPVLTAAMQDWFENYDTGLPFTGELYIPGATADDDAIRSSSIKDRPIRAGFSEFSFGHGMLGCMPDMTKDD